MTDKSTKGPASKNGNQKTGSEDGDHIGAGHTPPSKMQRFAQIKECTCCKAKPTDKVRCRVKLDRQMNAVPDGPGCMSCCQNYVAGDFAMWTSHDFSNFTLHCEENSNNEDVRQKFLRAVVMKQGDEATGFLRGDAYREVNSGNKVHAKAIHYTMQSFQDEHGMSITDAGFKVQQFVNIKGQ